MTDSALLALAHNASLLLAFAVIYDAFVARLPSQGVGGSLHQMLLGVLTGSVGIALMLTPWRFESSIIFDTRSVLLAITGLFLGVVPAVIAMAMTGILRLFQGGEAAWIGVAVIVASGFLGLAWRWRHPRIEDLSFVDVYVLGLTVHIVMLALMFALPRATALGVLASIAIPVLVVYPLATALLGTMLVNRARRENLVLRLRDSEERLRLALEAANQGLFDLNVQTGEAVVSPEYATMLGYDPATFHETNAAWMERIHPEDREPVAATYRDYIAGKTPDYRVEFRQRHADGEWHWILSVGRIVARDAGGKPLRMAGIHADITARKVAEEQLMVAQAQAHQLLAKSDASRLALLSVVEDLKAAEVRIAESEGLYRELFNNMHEGLAYCRLITENGTPRDFLYLLVNASFERMRGVSQLTNRLASEALPGFPDANPELLAAYGRVTFSGVTEVVETHIARLDRWFLVSAFSPRPGHFVSAWLEITERKRAELDDKAQLAELTRWYRATLGREGRIMELKADVDDLRRRLGEEPLYAHAATGHRGEPT